MHTFLKLLSIIREPFMTTADYILNLNKRYKQGNATEHTFRSDLQVYIESLVPDIQATNEPKRQACGAPDYVLLRNKIPVGYIEAKDIGVDLSHKSLQNQFKRYKESLENLIITDYINFEFYFEEEKVTEIRIAEIKNGQIVAIPENFVQFENLLKDFSSKVTQTIRSSKKLAEMMAGKARMLADVIENALTTDEESNANTSLHDQMLAFKEVLIHDITPKQFADIYAQTIAYGMFAARMNDDSLEDFSREEAAILVPKSNPFLRKLFQYISGYDIDVRIEWIVTALADVFRATDVEAMLKNFGKATQTQDPMIHFYEDFLAEYDPKLRKQRGVWYTPAPVVNFIVRAVDDILKTEFDLPQGLASIDKTKIKVNTQNPDKRSATGYKQVEKEVHKVQVLDPATGTGTFLAEVIRHVYDNKFKHMQGAWSGYVDDHLIPRLNGFELLMASYAMAHLNLELLLKETGYKSKSEERLRVYLTNALEEHHPDTGNLFGANWLSTEANEANHIKRDTPVMCVIGNPPYSGISSNNGEWIGNLIEDYKYVDGEHFNERKHWLNDDYVKFIRYGQHFIEKNGSGVLAFINPHGFLDNPTFRGMRWNLLRTFDKIHVIDLHGNSNRKETTLNGDKDENVFDIQQGVSINLFIKTGKKKLNSLGKVYHIDIYGKRESKYNFLSSNKFSNIQYKEITYSEPYYFFSPKNELGKTKYYNGFAINKLFKVNSSGIITAGDNFITDDSYNMLKNRINEFFNEDYSSSDLKNKYNLGKNYPQWILNNKRNLEFDEKLIRKFSFRPFDNKYLYYEPEMIWRFRNAVTKNYMVDYNIGLISARSNKSQDRADHFFISNLMSEAKTGESTTQSYNFPLYLYPEKTEIETTLNQKERIPNLDLKIVEKIAEGLKLKFIPDHEDTEAGRDGTFTPLDLLDYIYAILHSPTYRETYKEFLKIDFPRVPYPEDADKFWQLVKLGGELRQIHLFESPKVEQFITTYPEDGDNVITRKITKRSPGFVPNKENPQIGKVWINDTQYFDKVPLTAWEFYIGGYQPAQKWLKDRKDRTLGFEDILHYQKIIVALTETDRIMREIDAINF